LIKRGICTIPILPAEVFFMTDIRTFPDTDALAAAAAQIMGDALAVACARGSARVGMVVPGGRTPRTILPLVLARDDIDWARLDVVASDERLVPVDDPASTEGLIADLFAQAGRPLHYVSFGTETDPGAALAQWRAGLATMAWPPAVAFLGIGDDAHTASLFVGRAESADHSVFATSVPETPPHVAPRLTLGLAAFSQCAQIVILANTPAKAAQLELSLKPGADLVALPVAAVLRMAQTVVLRV
jgi:6-phosphogluconolactonase